MKLTYPDSSWRGDVAFNVCSVISPHPRTIHHAGRDTGRPYLNRWRLLLEDVCHFHVKLSRQALTANSLPREMKAHITKMYNATNASFSHTKNITDIRFHSLEEHLKKFEIFLK